MTSYLAEIFLLVGAILVLILDVFKVNKNSIWFVSLVSITGSLMACLFNTQPTLLLGGSFVNHELVSFIKFIFILGALIGILIVIPDGRIQNKGEYVFLLILSTLGSLLVISARELILFFVCFELMSIPLYVLSGINKKDEKSVEAALKFFVYGTFSSALMIMGMALVYGLTGETLFSEIKTRIKTTDPLFILGTTLFLSGLGFKIAMVPFHMWLPDTYEGAPTPFVAYLSVVPKIAGFAILLILMQTIFDKVSTHLKIIMAFFSGVTMTIGNLMAIPQNNLKRLLGYSSIAHIGYMLLAIASLTEYAIAMLLFYFVSYLFSNLGVFIFAQIAEENENSTNLDAIKGYVVRNPLLGFYMLIFLLSLGGIPFVVGFWGKLFIFLGAIKEGYVGLVFLGALLTVVALFYYLNVARKLFIEKPVKEESIKIPLPLHISLFVCTLTVILFGVYPRLLTDLTLKITKLPIL